MLKEINSNGMKEIKGGNPKQYGCFAELPGGRTVPQTSCNNVTVGYTTIYGLLVIGCHCITEISEL